MLISCLDPRWHIDADLDAANIIGMVHTEAMLIHDVQEEWHVRQSNSSNFVRANVEIRVLGKQKNMVQ